jgi:hypothetical protein
MDGLHAALAWAAAAAVVAVLGAALLTATGRLATYRILDRLILAQLAVGALAATAGAATATSSAPPRDVLHLLYGALAVIVPVAVRVWAQGRAARSVGRSVAVAALIALGATVRSFMTGS